MIEVQIRPLDLATWPGQVTPAASRRPPQFRSSWSDTLVLLDDELRHLAAKDVVIEAGFRSRDLRPDGWPRADAKDPDFPGVVLSFESSVGPLRYATDTFERGSYWVKGRDGRPGSVAYVPAWQANVRAIALGLEALRAVDRYGITKRGEQYQGWAAIGPAALALPQWTMTPEEAATLLGIGAMADMTKDEVSNAFRRLARENDPNQGGDVEVFHRLTRARDVLFEVMR